MCKALLRLVNWVFDRFDLDARLDKKIVEDLRKPPACTWRPGDPL